MDASRLPRIRPKQGQVLVELLPEPNQERGFVLPDNRVVKDRIGRKPLREAVVHSCGVWPTTAKGRPFAYEFHKGSRVFVDPVIGMELRSYPRVFRIYNWNDILAVVTA